MKRGERQKSGIEYFQEIDQNAIELKDKQACLKVIDEQVKEDSGKRIGIGVAFGMISILVLSAIATVAIALTGGVVAAPIIAGAVMGLGVSIGIGAHGLHGREARSKAAELRKDIKAREEAVTAAPGLSELGASLQTHEEVEKDKPSATQNLEEKRRCIQLTEIAK